MILWDCGDCGKVRMAPCAPACIAAERIPASDFRGARVRQELSEAVPGE